MTAKAPDSPQESRPPTAASSTSSVPAQSAGEPVTGATGPVAKAVPAQGSTQASATQASATQAPAAQAAAAQVPGAQAPGAQAPAAPAKPPAKAPASRPDKSGRGTGGLAFVVAVLAVLIAAGSTLVSVYALDIARQAKSRTAETAAPRTTGPPAVAGSASASPGAATASPTPPPVAFVPDVVRTDLRIPPAEGCVSVFVDVDTMRVGVDSGHEFYLTSCLGTPQLRIDKTSGAVPTQANPTPEVCVAQLAGSTPTSDLVLQVRTGLTFCLLTNKDEATRQSIPQRVGIVEVRDMGFDKSVTVTVSTYRVPS
jgi:hypothetical protein